MSRYAVYIHESLLDIAPKKGIQRKLLMAFIRNLGTAPFRHGDFTDTDETGRAQEVAIVGRFAVSWWPDHAAQEIKVTSIQLADL